MSENVASHDFPAHLFPFTILFFDENWKVLREERITGPTVVKVPPNNGVGPIGNQITYADGSMAVVYPPPRAVFDQGDAAVRRWLASRCDEEDSVDRVAGCNFDKGHHGACEVKFFMPGTPYVVQRITFNPRPIEDLHVPGVSDG